MYLSAYLTFKMRRSSLVAGGPHSAASRSMECHIPEMDSVTTETTTFTMWVKWHFEKKKITYFEKDLPEFVFCAAEAERLCYHGNYCFNKREQNVPPPKKRKKKRKKKKMNINTRKRNELWAGEQHVLAEITLNVFCIIFISFFSLARPSDNPNPSS